MRRHARGEQENFWSGDFGNQYTQHNPITSDVLAQRLALWTSVLSICSPPPLSILELGANVGINLQALSILLPKFYFTGVEINSQAVNILRNTLQECNNIAGDIIESSVFEFLPTRKWDIVISTGFLMHVEPEMLNYVYELMNNVSSRYIFINEYYNKIPITVSYHGHDEKLFKRDFAGEILEKFPEYKLRGYRFQYYRDILFSGRDETWFLLERNT